MCPGRRLAAVLLCAAATAPAAAAGEAVVGDVPSYIWYYGCGPTAAGMIVGYWDAHGYPDLITAGDGTNSWTTNQQAVKDMIASPGHFRDYWPTPDRVPSEEDPYHADDCVADFMSGSRDPLKAGESYDTFQRLGLTGYAEDAGYGREAGYSFDSPCVSVGNLWDPFVASIDAARPVELFVDSTADGKADHFVTAIGYDDTPGAFRYACYNTYDHEVHWYAFACVAKGRPYGVATGTLFQVRLTGDTDTDGDVDFLDYLTVKANFGTEDASWEVGDFDGDWDVDFYDFLAVKENFGRVLGTGEAVPQDAAPEPGTLTLLSACAGLVLAGRRRCASGPFARLASDH